MSTSAPQQQPASPAEQQHATAALIIAMASGVALTATALAPIALPLAVDAKVMAGVLDQLTSLTPASTTASVPERVALAENLSRQARFVVNATRRLDSGVSPAIVDADIRRHLSAQRARAGAALAVGQAMREHRSVILGWQAVRDSRTTAGCRWADGSNFHVRRPPRIEGQLAYPGWPHGGTCFPAGTLVAGPRPVASTARWYVGEMLDIWTVAGKRLSVTPNHPMLTAQGWVSAGLLNESCDLVCGLDAQRMALEVGPDDHQVEALIEDVAQTLGGAPVVVAGSVPSTPVDFHGDGIDGEVQVVWADRLLLDTVDPVLVFEPDRDQRFGGGDEDLPAFASESSLALGVERRRASFVYGAESSGELRVAANGSVSGLGVAQVLVGGALAHHQPVGGGAVTHRDAGDDESFADRGAADGVGSGERVDRFAGLVRGNDRVHGQRVARHELGAPGLLSEGAGFRGAARQPPLGERAREHSFADGESLGGTPTAFAREIELDRVLEVGWRRFAGHVYNLTTPTGWYIANGLVVHNCRCRPVAPYASGRLIS